VQCWEYSLRPLDKTPAAAAVTPTAG
jgi:hypothetical protein